MNFAKRAPWLPSRRELRLGPGELRLGLQRLLGEDRVAAWLVAAVMAAQLAVIAWDQPSAIGWENDGVAPVDFLRGVIDNLRPGHGHRYPLFHNLLLAILCLPILLISALSGPLSGEAVLARVTSLPALTAMSLLIKTAHVLLGGALLLMIARVARRLFGTNAGRGALLCAATSLTISYYTRASNLDGPYMFWTALAIDRLLTLIERGTARDYGLLGLFVAAAVATKDQAYAGFVLTLPIFLIAFPLCARTALAAGRAHWAHLRHTFVASGLGYALFAGVIVNPSGFIARLKLLTGTNSQDWRNYARTFEGVRLNLFDLWRAQTQFFWHAGVIALCWSGVICAVAQRPGSGPRARSARLLPAVAALSSVVAFTLPVARCEHRFVLPLGVWLSVYGGAALGWLWERRRVAWPVLAVAAGALLLSALQTASLALTQWCDARREVELALARLPAGSIVETYGFNVYLPRFDPPSRAPYRVKRIGKEPPNKRARNAALSEIEDRYADVRQRAPDVVLVTEGFAERFLARSFRPGEAPSAQWSRAHSDADAVSYFRAALRGTIAGYHLAKVAEPRLPSWARALGAQPIAIHDHTTAQRVWWFARARSSTGSNTSSLPPAGKVEAEVRPKARAPGCAAAGLTPDLLTQTSNKLLYSCAILPPHPRH